MSFFYIINKFWSSLHSCKNGTASYECISPINVGEQTTGNKIKIWVTMIASNFINPVHGCSFGAWALVLGHPLLFIPYVLRCYRLHLIFNLAVEKRTASAGTTWSWRRSWSLHSESR